MVYVNASVATPSPTITSVTPPPPPVAAVSQPPPLTATVRERGPPAMPAGAIDNHYNTNLPPGLGLGFGNVSSSAVIPSSQIPSQISSQIPSQTSMWGAPPPLKPSPSNHINTSNQPSSSSFSSTPHDSHGYQPTHTPTPSYGSNGHHQTISQQQQQLATEQSAAMRDKVILIL